MGRGAGFLLSLSLILESSFGFVLRQPPPRWRTWARGLLDDTLASGVSVDEAAPVCALAEDMLEVAWSEPRATMFLEPVSVYGLSQELGRLSDLCVHSYGGYPQAERQRLVLSRASELTDDEVASIAQVSVVSILGDFLFQPATERDFAEALELSLPEEERGLYIGDIIVLGERGAQAIVGLEVADALASNVKEVNGVSVAVERQGVDALRMRPPSVKEMQTVEASVRVDAVASAGLGLSRSKVAAFAKAKDPSKSDLLVNWRPVSSASTKVKQGDVISIRGRGRLTVDSVETNAKGKFRVKMTKYT
mmetsp:Transcript_11817/g.27674  ORF Transcript_11817/g.27674 Transcript_11817/m.27674 type:complete len:307 (+) Transcript_11817:58-978(+)